MTSITVVCVTTDETKDACGLTLDKSTKKWTGSEPGGASDVIKSKSGKFKKISAPDNGTMLYNDDEEKVMFLKLFDPDNPGDKGKGLAIETGRPIDWDVKP